MNEQFDVPKRFFAPNSLNTPCVPWRRCCQCVTSGTPYTKGGFMHEQFSTLLGKELFYVLLKFNMLGR